jgi:hypothetical protein
MIQRHKYIYLPKNMKVQLSECVKEIIQYRPYFIQSVVMKDFIQECEDKLFDKEYFEQLEKCVEQIAPPETNKFLHFLLEVAYYSNHAIKEKILDYVLARYPEDLKHYEMDIYQIIRIMPYVADKLKCIEKFSGEEFKSLHQSIYREMGSKILYDRYIEIYRDLILLKKENESLKSELNMIQNHLDYMPGGKGYLESKNDFEDKIKNY